MRPIRVSRSGMTLVEVLVGAAIGAFLVLVSTKIIISFTDQSVRARRTSEFIGEWQRLRYAVNLAKDDALRTTVFWNEDVGNALGVPGIPGPSMSGSVLIRPLVVTQGLDTPTPSDDRFQVPYVGAMPAADLATVALLRKSRGPTLDVKTSLPNISLTTTSIVLTVKGPVQSVDYPVGAVVVIHNGGVALPVKLTAVSSSAVSSTLTLAALGTHEVIPGAGATMPFPIRYIASGAAVYRIETFFVATDENLKSIYLYAHNGLDYRVVEKFSLFDQVLAVRAAVSPSITPAQLLSPHYAGPDVQNFEVEIRTLGNDMTPYKVPRSLVWGLN